ncbi:hypothetical protein GGQ80_000779 [Sphingomonas jinjuensis]|uniref:Uncharacterized protein n=1 Tax=Sphingomonas jinjuensis TaxID=535907 RepID=A0A840F8L7_9SPHN|nr:hypothetical protein [Sphingomonas jinjuensis]MBB4152891.1 hypothetical protein [Sphingomonas jinjuensis]
MLPGMALAGAGARVPIVLQSLARSASVPVAWGGNITILNRSAGSTLSAPGGVAAQGSSSTSYRIDDVSGVLMVMNPSGSGKQPGYLESFAVVETLGDAANSPRTSFITVTYT